MSVPRRPRVTDPGALLRRAVLDHVTAETRRVFPPVLHAGVPGEHVLDLPQHGVLLDHGLRTDVVAALAARARRDLDRTGVTAADPLVWVTRPGSLDVRDDDLAWSAAAHAAALELAAPLPLVVVTRRGWCDPRSGASRTWRRLRPTRR
jgi:hypothetical protein